MDKRRGFLLAILEPAPSEEEEFNDWYDTEHVPERMRIPGFETAHRWVCTDGWPRYLSFYDLADPGIADGEDYKRVSGANFSPWSKRVMRRVRGQYRAAGAQLDPGDAATIPTARLEMLRFRGLTATDGAAVLAGLCVNFAERPETVQLRLFESPTIAGCDFIGLIGLRAPREGRMLDLRAFGAAAAGLDLVNAYAPYWTHGPMPGLYPDP